MKAIWCRKRKVLVLRTLHFLGTRSLWGSTLLLDLGDKPLWIYRGVFGQMAVGGIVAVVVIMIHQIYY